MGTWERLVYVALGTACVVAGYRTVYFGTSLVVGGLLDVDIF